MKSNNMTHNFAMYGVSKVLMHPNDETARDKKAGGELVEQLEREVIHRDLQKL